MAYIGKEPIVGNFQVCDAISVVNGQASYTMQVSSTNVVPESANHMLVSLNGILQKPNSSFTVSGSTITFASNLATGDVIDFIMLLGNVLDIGTPSDSTVTNAKTNFVSTSSGAGLSIKGDGTTDGTLQLNCSQNSHGIKLASPAHSAGQSYTLTFPTGNVTADKFLKVASISGSGTTATGQLSFADAGGGGIEVLDKWRSTTDQTPSSTNTDEIISSGWSQYTPTGNGTIGSAMTESSGIFTFPSTGIYRVDLSCYFFSNYDDLEFCQLKIFATTNNSSYSEVSKNALSIFQDASVYQGTYTTAHIDVTDTSNVKVAGYINLNSGGRIRYKEFLFTRLADT